MEHVDRLDIRQTAGGSVIAVKVVPGASRDKLAGALGDALKVTTAAPPEKGKANQAVAATLAKALGVSRRDVHLEAGPTSPRKEFLVEGLSPKQLRARLSDL